MHPSQRVVSALLLLGVASTLACGGPTVGTITVTATPAEGTVADGTALVTLVATAKTADGKAAEGAYLQFYSDSAGARFEPASALGPVAKDGTFSVQVASTVAGKRRVIAKWLPVDPAVTPVETAIELTFVAGASVGPGSSLKLAPASQVVGGNRTITGTVVLLDGKGNASPAQSFTVSSSVATDVLTPASPVTDDAGRATFTVAATKSGARTITATLANGDVLSGLVTFRPDVVDPETSTATADAAATADGLDVATVTATARDAHGNLLAGVPVVFETGEGSALIARSRSDSLTDSDGTAQARFSSLVAGSREVLVHFGDAFTKPVSLVLEPGAVSPSVSTVTRDRADAPADGTSGISFKVSLRDLQGNPVVGRNIVATTDVATLTLAPGSANTDAAGTATFRLAGTTAAAVALQFAVEDGPTLTSTATLRPLAPSAGQSTLAAAPANAVADGITAVVAQLDVRDVHGNAVPALGFSVSTGQAADVVAAPAATGADGRARLELRSTVAGTRQLTVALASGSTLTTEIAFIPGPPSATRSQLVLPTTTAGSTASIEVLARDAHGNAVPSADVNLHFRTAGQDVREPVEGLTNEVGVLGLDVPSSEPTTLDVIATISGISISGRLAFVAGPPSDLSELNLPEGSVRVDAGGARVAVRLVDALGFPVPNWPVRLAVSGDSVAIDPAPVVRSDGLGEATFVVQTTRAQLVALTFDPEGDSVAPLQGRVTFSSGALAPSATVVHLPTSPTSDDLVHTIGWDLFDTFGNPATGVAVRPVVNGATRPQELASDASGHVEWAYSQVVAGTYAIGLSADEATFGAGSLTIAPGAPAGGTSYVRVVAASGTLRSDGTSGVDLEGFVADAAGNPIPGRSVTFTVNIDRATLSPTQATSGADGLVRTRLTTTLAADHTVSIRVGRGSLASTVVRAAPGAIAAARTVITPSAGDRPVVGVSFQLRVTVADVNGNAVPGASLRLDRSRTNVTVTSGNPLVTDASGIAIFTLTSQVTGTATLTAVESTTATTAGSRLLTFVAGTPSATNSTFIASRAEGTADGTDRINLTFTARDSFGNLAADVAVDWTGSSNLLLSQPLVPTGADGVATGSVVASVPGIYTVTPRANGTAFTGLARNLDFGAIVPDQPVAGRVLASAGCRVLPTSGDLGTWSRPLAVDGTNIIHSIVTCGGTLNWFTSQDGGRTFSNRGAVLPTASAAALTSGGRWVTYLAAIQAPSRLSIIKLDARLGTATVIAAPSLSQPASMRGLSIHRVAVGALNVAARLADLRVEALVLTEGGTLVSRQVLADPNSDAASVDVVPVLGDATALVGGSQGVSGGVFATWQNGPGTAFGSTQESISTGYAVDAAAGGNVLAISRGLDLAIFPLVSGPRPFGTLLSIPGLVSPDRGRSVAVAPDGAAFVGSSTSLGRLFVQRLAPGAGPGSTLESVELGNNAAVGLVLAPTPSGQHVAYMYQSNAGDVRFGIAGF